MDSTHKPWIQAYIRRFQSPKHVIKAKKLRLTLIDVAIPGFLTKPLSSGTQDAGLSSPLASKLLYSHEQPLPSDEEQEEPASEPTREDIEKDFEVFIELTPKIPQNLVIIALLLLKSVLVKKQITFLKQWCSRKKMPNLLALFTAYAGGNASTVPIVPRPFTPAPPYSFSADAAKKKRKRGKSTKKESFEKGEIPQSTQQPPFKEPIITRV